MCNKHGSLREDCNQEDGRCECKPHVYGMKCTECAAGRELTAKGCVSAAEQEREMERLCGELVGCHYPGAYCTVEEGGEARCVCDTISCDEARSNLVVCGDDGQTYASECDLIRFACVKQADIQVAYLGKCTQGTTTV